MQLPTQFFDAVLPVQGWRVFDFIMPGPPGNRPVAQFDFMPYGMNELGGLLDWGMRKGADVYVAISSYGSSMRTIMQGSRAGEQVVSRKADNTLYHRCLRIDVDCGAGKPYADKAAGWAAIKAFLGKVPLPMPLVVDSGYGLHVYWLFDRDLDTPTWLGMANHLAACMLREGLQVDPTTTVDAARILRVPGTINFKNGQAVPVRQLCMGAPTEPAVYMQVLGAYALPTSVTGIAGQMPASMRGSASPLSAGLHPPYTLRGVLLGCPGVAAMLQSHGAGVSEPLWHATLALIQKADEPIERRERVARALSDGHAGFDEGGFQAKWAQVVGQDYEPPTCEKFASLGMPECATCPHRAVIKSPCVLGRAQPLPPPPDPALAVPMPTAPLAMPAPPPMLGLQSAVTQGIFVITQGMATVQIVDGNLTSRLCIKDGIPCVVKTEPNPDPSKPPTRTLNRIGSYAIISAERLLDEGGTLSLTALTFNRQTDGFVRIEFSQNELSDGRSFSRLLNANGVHLNATDVKLLQDKFMPEFLAQLQRLKQANAIAGRCGWTAKFDRFVLGTRVFSANGVEHVRPANAPEEMEAYHEQGNEALWRQAFDLVLASGPSRQALVALGIAGPLLAFAGADGVLLNAWSPETGVGKSTLCDAILSIWGAPNKLRKDYRDTAAATFQLAAVSGNMPMVIDEFTNVDGKDLSNYVYTITQGRERHRLDTNSKLRSNNNRWCLPFIATSNNSVHDKLQMYRQDAVAEAARVFELRLHPLTIDPAAMGQAKLVLQHFKSHYGFLGSKIVQLYMAKPESYWRQVVGDRIAWWDAQMANDTGDRFRSITAALVDIGASIGVALGFNFDRVGITAVLREQWRIQIAELEAVRVKPEDFIHDYISDNLTKFAVFGGQNSDTLIGALANEYVGEIKGTLKHNKLSIDAVCIPAKNLREYIIKRNGTPRAVTEWINQQKVNGGCVQQVGQMTFLSGTPRAMRNSGYRFTAAVLGQTVLAVTGAPGQQTIVQPAKGGTP